MIKRYSGFALIEIILVLVIIAVLSGWYFSKGSSPTEQAASQYKHSMERANNTACLASRTALRTAIMAYSMQNQGKPLTRENLQAANIRIGVCPEQGQITVNTDGTLSCSKHQP